MGSNSRPVDTSLRVQELLKILAMPKIVLGERNLLALKRYLDEKKDKPPFESDEFTIGDEGGSPTYYHAVNEGAYFHRGIDVDTDRLYCMEVEPDDLKPEDWDDEEDGEWTLEDNAEYWIVGYDASGDVLFKDTFGYGELSDFFSDELVEQIVNHKEGVNRFWIQDIPFLDKPDPSNPDEVWAFLKRMSDDRGPSGFILPDGECVYSYDHLGMAQWADLTLTQLLAMGAIRFTCTFGIDLSVEPTRSQLHTLKALLRNANDTIYIDIDDPTDNGRNYPDTICSGSYDPEMYEYAVNDIMNYFENGIKLMSEGKERVNENIIDEVEPEEVDLSSFKKKGRLNPKIWKDGELNPKIRLKLLDIADDFWDTVGVSWVKPKDYILIGSMCGYNWSEFSDIDLHVLIDFSKVDERSEFVKEYFNLKKNEWNDKHTKLEILGYSVEVYIQDINEPNASNGVYSLEKNKWLKVPSEEATKPIGPEKYEIKDRAAEIMTAFDNLVDEYNATDDLYRIEKIGERNERILDSVNQARKNDLKKSGEMSMGNIIYKVLRRSGYLDKMHKFGDEVYDRVNSIKESLLRRIARKVSLNEEVVADGNAQHNPYKERWKQEREDLKDYIITYGSLKTSMENGKQYVVLFEPEISKLVGNNYGLCVQYDPIKREYRTVIYIRAMDKFTDRIFNPEFDTSGMDNISGTADDNIVAQPI